MTFREQYLALEEKFRQQVEKDNKELTVKKDGKEHRLESKFVYNIEPDGPVDFILIAKEPSTGVSGKKAPAPSNGKTRLGRNFCWSTEDFVFHSAIREYLCQGKQSYHLTDLAKGGMPGWKAKSTADERYKRWYCLLKEELRLVAKLEKTRIIAIGNDVYDFLKSKSLCHSIEKVIHYSPQGWMARKKAVQPYIDRFQEFDRTIDRDAFEETVKDVLKQAGMDSQYIDFMLEKNVNKSKLTESRRKSLLYYKNRLQEIQACDSIILKQPAQWA